MFGNMSSFSSKVNIIARLTPAKLGQLAIEP